MTAELDLIEHKEMLEGLMVLTSDNVGLSCELLKKVIKRTEYEVQTTLKEIADNIDVEIRRARRRALYALNRNMRLSSNHSPKPEYTAAHHIVAWCDQRARVALSILVKWDIGIHNEVNGVYLPRFEKNTPHKGMPNSIAHSKIHTDFYHANVVTMLVAADVPGATYDDIIDVLKEISEDLEDGDFPIDELMVR